jgi:nicotinate dehydrogenase subunit B
MISVRTGKVELGQGIRFAIARIAAEELDVALERIEVQTADTADGPNELITAGSQSVSESGTAVRYAAAEARAQLIAAAAEELRVEPAELRVEDGTVLAPDGRSTTYWRLMEGRRFNVQISGVAAPKPADAHRLLGRPGTRSDMLGIVTGSLRYVHDLQRPGMLHARVLRPSTPNAKLDHVDESVARSIPGVTVVKDGSFIGVLAEREEQAIAALDALRARAVWTHADVFPVTPTTEWLVAEDATSFMVVEGHPVEAAIEEIAIPEEAFQTLEATFSRPFQMHASIGPSAALAEWRESRLTVWTHSQSVHLLAPALAEALGLQPEQVRAVHVEGAGCYGHNGADDAAFDAALLALSLPDTPVLLKWTRGDEHAWEPYAPPAVVKTCASLDAQGRLVYWSLETWGTTHNSRAFPYGPRTALLGAWQREDPMPRQPPTPMLMREAGIHRNATPLYSIPQKRIVKHFVPREEPRTSSIRSLGAYANVFAIESFVDELAWAAGADPLTFRLAHLDDPRARDVLAAAAERADWANRPFEPGRGYGIGLARYKNQAAYAAVVVEVRVDDDTARIHLENAVVAADAGQIVDPSGVANQLEGGIVQSASWTLYEEVVFESARLVNTDWDTYPIVGFADAPSIEVVLIDRPGAPFLGCGEAAQGPTVGAIANAVFAATGLHLREIPFTPARVRQAAETQEVPART